MKGKVAVTTCIRCIATHCSFLIQSESERASLQKEQTPIIQAAIWSKMAIIPFPFSNPVLVSPGRLPEKA